jgi:hypothetical protein
VEAKWVELTKVDTWRRDAYIKESGFTQQPCFLFESAKALLLHGTKIANGANAWPDTLAVGARSNR